MRLIKINRGGELSLTGDLIENIPPYAILSHTWGPDDTETTFNDLKAGRRDKVGYSKIEFTARQAQKDGLGYIWVDTCCIDKANYTELSEAITSMFRWYQEAKRCYVYLSGVPNCACGDACAESQWELAFRKSRWFTRGWTLQELLAPKSVEFFSEEGDRLGDKKSLEILIQQITHIPLPALRGSPLSGFSVEEKMRWAENRNTKKKEDRAYCLLGIFNVFIPLIYGEGENAFMRLREAIDKSSSGLFSQRKEQLLASLNHGSPFTRSNNIPQPAEGTFDWILNKEIEDQNEFYIDEGDTVVEQFRYWLQHGTGLYWIKGKPGSGKSTFMKFLTGSGNTSPGTLRYLEVWATPRNPYIASFYFWLADKSGIQNSFRGFICHLLYQLLSRTDGEFASSLVSAERIREKHSLDNWDPVELESILKTVAARVSADTPLCFFIDALDECMGKDLDRVLKIINDLILASTSQIKFCVSSRPETKIQNRLRGVASHSLDLHTLTQEDIRVYVTAELETCWGGGIIPTKVDKKSLINELVQSAEGVFLWAFVVTNTISESIEFGDSISQLKKQLMELPRDMTQLYKTMLKRSNATTGSRKAEAASCLRFVLDHSQRYVSHEFSFPELSCREVPLGGFLPLYEKFHGKVEPEVSFLDILKVIRHRIITLCAGLVTIEGDESSSKVDFFHRTARDFLREPDGQDILRQSSLTQLESFCLYVDGVCNLRHSACLNVWKCRWPNLNAAQSMINWHQDMNECSEADKLYFLEYVNKILGRIYAATYGGKPKDWVYNVSKASLSWNDDYLDFASFDLLLGSSKLISHHLTTTRSFTQNYKDLLLLGTSSSNFRFPDFGHLFLQLGGNPNAIFYWNLKDRIKITPWLAYLMIALRPFNYKEAALHLICRPQVTDFLHHGASLDDRTVIFRCVNVPVPEGRFIYETAGYMLSKFRASDMPPKPLNDVWPAGMLLVIEVNAKYLLEEQFLEAQRNYRQAAAGRGRFVDVLSDHPLSKEGNTHEFHQFFGLNANEVSSYRRVLLVHPGCTFDDVPSKIYFTPDMDLDEEYGAEDTHPEELPESEADYSPDYRCMREQYHRVWKRYERWINELKAQYHGPTSADTPENLPPLPWAEVSSHDSEALLDGLNLFEYWKRPPKSSAGWKFRRKQPVVGEIWKRSPKVMDAKKYLGSLGYYKEADDPAFFQGPIPMFEDDE